MPKEWIEGNGTRIVFASGFTKMLKPIVRSNPRNCHRTPPPRGPLGAAYGLPTAVYNAPALGAYNRRLPLGTEGFRYAAPTYTTAALGAAPFRPWCENYGRVRVGVMVIYGYSRARVEVCKQVCNSENCKTIRPCPSPTGHNNTNVLKSNFNKFSILPLGFLPLHPIAVRLDHSSTRGVCSSPARHPCPPPSRVVTTTPLGTGAGSVRLG